MFMTRYDFYCSALHHVDLCLGRARGWSCVTTFRPFHRPCLSRASIRAFFSIITFWIRMTGEHFTYFFHNPSSAISFHRLGCLKRLEKKRNLFVSDQLSEMLHIIELIWNFKSNSAPIERKTRKANSWDARVARVVIQKLIKKVRLHQILAADFRFVDPMRKKRKKSLQIMINNRVCSFINSFLRAASAFVVCSALG